MFDTEILKEELQTLFYVMELEKEGLLLRGLKENETQMWEINAQSVLQPGSKAATVNGREDEVRTKPIRLKVGRMLINPALRCNLEAKKTLTRPDCSCLTWFIQEHMFVAVGLQPGTHNDVSFSVNPLLSDLFILCVLFLRLVFCQLSSICF